MCKRFIQGFILFSWLAYSALSYADTLAKNAFRDPAKVAKIEAVIKQHLALLNINNEFERPVLAQNYAVPIRNPFTQLAPPIVNELGKSGIDIKAMSAYKALYVAGTLSGSYALKIINTDPKTILVIGSGTVTHQGIYSRGPIVVVGDVAIMSELYSQDLVWYGELAGGVASDESIGLPIITSSGKNKNHSFGVSPYSVVEEIQAALALGSKKTHWLSTQELIKQNKLKVIANPVKKFTAQEKNWLTTQGIDLNKIAQLKTFQTVDYYYGGILNADPNSLIVIESDTSSSEIYSRGAVIVKDKRFSDVILSDNLLWMQGLAQDKKDESLRHDWRGQPLIWGNTKGVKQ